MAVNMKQLEELLEKMKNDIKTDVETVVKTEISNLNVATLIDEQNKKYDEIIKMNNDLKETISKQQKTIENIQRRNNLIFFGISEGPREGTDELETSIIDVCNNVLNVEMNKRDINFIKRIGISNNKKRPILVSYVTNKMKSNILFNANKLKGSGIFVTADYDKETQAQRKELRLIQAKLKESGQSSKLKGTGLVINNKFCPYAQVIQEYTDSKSEDSCSEAGGGTEHEDGSSNKAGKSEEKQRLKKRKFKTPSPPKVPSGFAGDNFRPPSKPTTINTQSGTPKTKQNA